MKYEIGERIRSIRVLRGISQKQLALMIGVSNSCVSNWETGVNRPDADTIAALCRALRASADDLLGVALEEENEPAACSDGQNEINRELLALLNQLTPEQALRVMDFVRGLLSSK